MTRRTARAANRVAELKDCMKRAKAPMSVRERSGSAAAGQEIGPTERGEKEQTMLQYVQPVLDKDVNGH